ncbi:conserved hypothetical protein [Pediculus humanus corporis]|uniref:Glycosyltransferase 61 catalytic domain-containing protein n=1 Tax=Pediculus humanus subsp. corporis TaxID=121224 RepID=E0VGB2_PEDHC|nr:uncharacterized protein Phum_PHUM177410 [Pediculus humanus corporis]EEB12418.1 conserved hypothetical protein [Pediculus humanus corporis]
MSVLHRALFTWFTLLVFLILLVLRVDNRTQWNWFVVFIPVWIFNAIILNYSVIDTVSFCKSRRFNRHVDVSMNLYLVTMIVLKLAFEIMLCLKLEYPSINLSTVYIVLPLWIILPKPLYLSSLKFNESSVWCVKEQNNDSVLKGFQDIYFMQKIQLSSILFHNQFYANITVVENYDYFLSKKVVIFEKKGFLISRIKPDNIMHVIHDDLFPLFLTLEFLCMKNDVCMQSFKLIFHDNFPTGPFFDLYKIFSKGNPILLPQLLLHNNNQILCIEEMHAGLILDSIWYQYGFNEPHGPVNNFFLNNHDIVRFTSYIKTKLNVHSNSTKNPDIVIISREKTRKILNVNEVTEKVKNIMKKLLRKNEINVMCIDLLNSNFTFFIKILSNCDLVIGMHGAEMIFTIFMKPHSLIIELFPFAIQSDIVSFIKPITKYKNNQLFYFSWENKFKNNSVPHPNAHPLLGGIKHLNMIEQEKIKNTQKVPAVICCNDPNYLYHMYQDTWMLKIYQRTD